MPRGLPRSRVLMGALWLGMLGPGCQRSQVWLGRANPAAATAAASGDVPVIPAQGTAADAAASIAPQDAGSPREATTDSVVPGVATASGANTSAAASGGPAGQVAADGGSMQSAEPKLPSPRGACPELVSGTAEFAGISTRLWVGAERPGSGPLLIYWHGVGSNPEEVSRLGSVLDEILAQGGIVAALAESTGQGTDTGTGTWSTGDLEVADEIVACANARGRIDPRRIYTGGCSAGGLTAGTMVHLRSSYLAGAQLDSGGTILMEPLQDPTHVPALIASHGSSSSDIVIVNYAMLAAELASQIAGEGGFAVECDHGGGHCGTPSNIRVAQWQFLMAHPFGTKPSPYASGLPKDFPSECRIARAR